MSYEAKSLNLYFEHRPDSTIDQTSPGVYETTELPGEFEIGVEVDGVKVPLAVGKAGRLVKQLDAAQKSGKSGASKSG